MEPTEAAADTESELDSDEEHYTASRHVAFRKAANAPRAKPGAPAHAPPPNAVSGKRKRKHDLPTGVSKNKKQFQIRKYDAVAKKYTTHLYKTLAEAEAAHAAERAARDELKRQRAARPQAEIRAENLARSGHKSKLERDFAIELHAADEKIKTMNDSVLADSCGFFYDDDPELALGIQLKVAEKPMQSQNNTWDFKHVHHYPRIPVVCWRADKKNGWIYDGTDLVKRKTEALGVTPGGINAKLAINTDDERTRATPLELDDIVARLRELAADRKRFPPHTKAFLSWQFDGKSHDQLKERIGLHLEELRDPGSTFPDAQNGSFDQLADDGVTRRQAKTGRAIESHNGIHVDLREHAGRVEGKKTYQPYAAGAFDELVVYVPSWQTDSARVWRIPASRLLSKGYLRTDTDKGKMQIYLYTSVEPLSKYRTDTDTWTAAYYEGYVPIVLPSEAEQAAGHLLDDLRYGIVA